MTHLIIFFQIGKYFFVKFWHSSCDIGRILLTPYVCYIFRYSQTVTPYLFGDIPEMPYIVLGHAVNSQGKL